MQVPEGSGHDSDGTKVSLDSDIIADLMDAEYPKKDEPKDSATAN
jgi:hypothetical protein